MTAEDPRPEPDIEWPGLAADIDGRRDIANAILPIRAAPITAKRRKGGSRRGYYRAQFESAWARYCAEGVHDGRRYRQQVLAIRYPAPAVGLPRSYRFATNGLLLRYIAGGGERYTN